MQEHLLEFSCFLQCCTQLGGGTSKDQGQAEKETYYPYVPARRINSSSGRAECGILHFGSCLAWPGGKNKFRTKQEKRCAIASVASNAWPT